MGMVGGEKTVTCHSCGEAYEMAAGSNPATWTCPHCHVPYFALTTRDGGDASREEER